ncbi:MAG: CoA transferase [Cognatishimia sp.]|uniref:CaiB/BaiF CoA transferase family protein n=1 Tax=Cognatishimia sp. TaxID=2211648 RepID=UPI003B8D1368
MSRPLEGVLVVDFSQFLAGPYASLRLQDLGARVIKVENPIGGDLCRHLYLSNTWLDGDSTLFHAINRGKESIALDLKSEEGSAMARALAAKGDVVIQNFRPGVIDRLGLDYKTLKSLNPAVVYGSISGYGPEGPWKDLPGQDLLAQARSGIMWLSGNHDDGPVPVGLPIADLLAGATLAQGLLAGLYKQVKQGKGTLVETSLLECLVDAQFELLTTYFNNGGILPQREMEGSAHAYLSAPYGVYETHQGQLALAMTPLPELAEKLGLKDLLPFSHDPKAAFSRRAEVRGIISRHFRTNTADHWERELIGKGIWCAKVLSWPEFLSSESFIALNMISSVGGDDIETHKFARSPLRLNGQRMEVYEKGPRLNADFAAICEEFLA